MDDETIEMVMTIISIGGLLVTVGLGVFVAILFPIETLAFIGLMFVLWVLAEYVFSDIIGDLMAAALAPVICGMVISAAPEDNNE